MFLESLNSKLNIIGVDEVGRGPLAGPVVSCAFSYSANKKQYSEDLSLLLELGVTDSKKISAKKRKIILAALGIDSFTLNTRTYLKAFRGKSSFCLCAIDEKKN